MAKLDDAKLVDLIENPPDGELSMSCSKTGNIFKCGAETYEVTDHQAGVLFDGGLQLMARIRLARG
jgi:hypothetical protein